MTDPAIPPYPLYDVTFNIQRISPLYTKLDHPLDNAALLQHSRSLRDILAGDTLRGVRVSLGSISDAGHVGSLQSVTWRMLPGEDVWGTEDHTDVDVAMGSIMGKGMVVEIDYEKIKYRAVFLRGDEAEIAEGGFEHFPLLLTRMPGSLRDAFMMFLSTTFDTRISPVHFYDTTMVEGFEKYLDDCGTGEDGEAMDAVESSRSLRKVTGDVKITLGFSLPRGNSGLQTVEFTVDREDVPRLVQRGKDLKSDSPFMKALSKYAIAHMGMNIDHDRVRIFQIACGAFVLGHEGKIKFNSPGDSAIQKRATWMLANGLVDTIRRGKQLRVDTF